MTIEIYHNPRCSKSRQALALLTEHGVEPRIVEYLKTPPDQATLSSLLDRLGMQPQELVRSGEPEYKELDLKNRELSRDEWIDILVKHPKLIERPIVANGKKAVLGRPPERVQEIL